MNDTNEDDWVDVKVEDFSDHGIGMALLEFFKHGDFASADDLVAEAVRRDLKRPSTFPSGEDEFHYFVAWLCACAVKSQNVSEIRAAVAQAVADLEKIVCTKEPDAGVVMLSQDGPTTYDPIAKCQVYKHQHFSPLGDALIALHKHLSFSIGAGNESEMQLEWRNQKPSAPGRYLFRYDGMPGGQPYEFHVFERAGVLVARRPNGHECLVDLLSLLPTDRWFGPIPQAPG